MNDLDQLLRDEIIDSLSELVMSNPAQAQEAGFDDVMIEVLSNLTPARRAFIHAHFHELFEFEHGAFDEIKQSLRPN